MKIKHTFRGELGGEVKEITTDNTTSPSGGYTQSYADRQGKDYEAGRAAELLGDDIWICIESKLLK